MQQTIDFYKENAGILYKTFEELGFKVHGGVNAPYIWIAIPGKPSWDTFADILERTNIVTTPGSGFGPAGEGFVRASAFGHRYALARDPLQQGFVQSRRDCFSAQPFEANESQSYKKGCVGLNVSVLYLSLSMLIP